MRASRRRSGAASNTGRARESSPPRFGSLDYWTWFPGVGFGDVKLLAMIGAVLGPFGVLEAIVLASLVGLAVGLLVTLSRRTWNTPFGFAPAIAVGALLALLAPDPFAWLAGTALIEQPSGSG